MSVLATVISYNNSDLTQRAYSSLVQQTESVDVVIWDNNSPDGSADRLKGLPYRSQDQFVASADNLMWSPALNEVFSRWGGDYDYFVMMNNDITLPPHAIESMIRYAQMGDVGSVGPMAPALGGFQDPVHKDRFGSGDSHQALYLLGACVMLRRAVWQCLGELDPLMPLGADDFDYAIRQKEAGLKIVVDREVCADHQGHASGNSPNWNRWGQKSWDHFNTKWAGYYLTEEEALNCQWGGEVKGWYRGTGWVSNERRAEIWKMEGRSGEPYVT